MSNHDKLCALAKGCTCSWIASAGLSCDGCECTCDIIENVRENDTRATNNHVAIDTYLTGLRNALIETCCYGDPGKAAEQTWHPADITYHVVTQATAIGAYLEAVQE